MKPGTGEFFENDDNGIQTQANGQVDRRVANDNKPKDIMSKDMSDVDRMYKLFNIPQETLPCPEKRQANEILMEQMSKNENINSATTIRHFSLTICCISFYVRALIS